MVPIKLVPSTVPASPVKDQPDPPEAVCQEGTPELSVNTCPSVPAVKLERVFVAEA